ncbi:MAG: DUF2946 domain-containing protein [Rhodospirillaceae bacterium]|nr:DUF2946 domain-containing protein [Rhodospirillaceae bacterium]MBL6930808.1 DUF2946 domain-containing protein [Rhodospirillales bacterium]
MFNLLKVMRLKRVARPKRQVASWLAMFALLMQVLMPFGQALAFDSPQDIEYQLICTANGIKQIPINGNDAPLPQQDIGPRCPFCTISFAPVLLQPDAIAAVIRKEITDDVSYGRDEPSRDATIWRGSSSPSRAPPLDV